MFEIVKVIKVAASLDTKEMRPFAEPDVVGYVLDSNGFFRFLHGAASTQNLANLPLKIRSSANFSRKTCAITVFSP